MQLNNFFYVSLNFDLILRLVLTYWGPYRIILWGRCGVQKPFLGFINLVEQLSFLTVEYDSSLETFLTFWVQNGQNGLEHCFCFVVEQLLFSRFSSTLAFDSELILELSFNLN